MPTGRQTEAALYRRRFIALGLSLTLAVGAGLLFLQYGAADGLDVMDFVRSTLIFGSTFWLSWGAVQGLWGLAWRPIHYNTADTPITARTAILVPVYNEDPVTTFSRVAAMDASIAALGLTRHFDFAILSDTRNEEVAQAERHWLVHLLRDRQAEGRIFYRRRVANTGKKAGNIEDFITRSGAAYDLCADPRRRQPDGRRDDCRDDPPDAGRAAGRPVAIPAQGRSAPARASGARSSSRPASSRRSSPAASP